MKNILCYGDSNTFGLSPDWIHGHFGRHDISVRWTGQLQARLGGDWRIIEEGLNGRTVCFDDPTMPDRNGLTHFRVALESHMPLDLVIIILGTNDTKPLFNASVFDIGMGLSQLIQCAKNPFIYSCGAVPRILIAAPVPLGPEAAANGSAEQVEKSKALASQFEQVAKMHQCEFIDLGAVASAAPGEGVHLNAQAHTAIAEAFEKKLREIFG